MLGEERSQTFTLNVWIWLCANYQLAICLHRVIFKFESQCSTRLIISSQKVWFFEQYSNCHKMICDICVILFLRAPNFIFYFKISRYWQNDCGCWEQTDSAILEQFEMIFSTSFNLNMVWNEDFKQWLE